MRIISRVEGKEGKGVCEFTPNSTTELYQEIRGFMFDCPYLTGVDMISLDKFSDFMNSNRESIRFGTTQGVGSEKCHFEARKDSQ